MVSSPGFPELLLGDRAADPEAAWDEFLHEFAPLLLRVVRLHERDPDRIDDCFVFVCEQLERDDLRRLRSFDLDGPASFSTWLRAVVRNLCLDWRRKRFGRPRPFHVIEHLPHLDREVYRAVHLRGLTESEALEAVRLSFPDLTPLELAESLERIERSLSAHQHWLLASIRLREVSLSTPLGGVDEGLYLDPPDDGKSPEERAALDEEVCALREAVATLPAQERLLLRLRYEQDLTLDEIARLTRVGSAVTVQRRIAQAVETLRGTMTEKERGSVSVEETQREA